MLRIGADLQVGEVVQRGRIPRYFFDKYAAENLYIVDLSSFHRMAYTIVGREVLLLDIMAHQDYDRIFGFRKK